MQFKITPPKKRKQYRLQADFMINYKTAVWLRANADKARTGLIIGGFLL